jgi:hypothetical protein
MYICRDVISAGFGYHYYKYKMLNSVVTIVLIESTLVVADVTTHGWI